MLSQRGCARAHACVYVCVCVCVWGRHDLANPHSRSLPLLGDGPELTTGRWPSSPFLSPPRLPFPPPGRTWGTRSGQQVNEEDGQADVQQDHHADEDGVGDLGIAGRGCLSPQESTLPDPDPPRCPAPVQTIRAGKILGGNNQPNCSGSREDRERIPVHTAGRAGAGIQELGRAHC